MVTTTNQSPEGIRRPRGDVAESTSAEEPSSRSSDSEPSARLGSSGHANSSTTSETDRTTTTSATHSSTRSSESSNESSPIIAGHAPSPPLAAVLRLGEGTAMRETKGDNATSLAEHEHEHEHEQPAPARKKTRWLKGLLPPEDIPPRARPVFAPKTKPQQRPRKQLSQYSFQENQVEAEETTTNNGSIGDTRRSGEKENRPIRMLKLGTPSEETAAPPRERKRSRATSEACETTTLPAAPPHRANALQTALQPEPPAVLSAQLLASVFGWQLHDVHTDNGTLHFALQHMAQTDMQATIALSLNDIPAVESQFCSSPSAALPPHVVAAVPELRINGAVGMTPTECATWLSRQTWTGYAKAAAAPPQPPAPVQAPAATAVKQESEEEESSEQVSETATVAAETDEPPAKVGRREKQRTRGRPRKVPLVDVIKPKPDAIKPKPDVKPKPDAKPRLEVKAKQSHIRGRPRKDADGHSQSVTTPLTADRAAASRAHKSNWEDEDAPLSEMVKVEAESSVTGHAQTVKHKVVPHSPSTAAAAATAAVPAAAQRVPPVGHSLPQMQGSITSLDGVETESSTSYLAHARSVGKLLAHREAAALGDGTQQSPLQAITSARLEQPCVTDDMRDGLLAVLSTSQLSGDTLHAAVQGIQIGESERSWYNEPVMSDEEGDHPVPFPRELPHAFLPVSGTALLNAHARNDRDPSQDSRPRSRELPEGIPDDTRIAIPAAFRLRGSLAVAEGHTVEGTLPGVMPNPTEDIRYHLHRRFMPKDVKDAIDAEGMLVIAEDGIERNPLRLIAVDSPATGSGTEVRSEQVSDGVDAAVKAEDMDSVLKRSVNILRVPMPDVEWRYGP